jgi:hypothetical protein
LAVICFADGGAGRVGHVAASLVATRLTSRGESTALYDCWGQDGPGERHFIFKEAIGNEPRRQLSARQFIDDLRRLRATHQHLIVDVSEATDQTAALAFGVADLTLIPLRPSNIDISIVTKTLELLEILSNHRRRSLSRAVFLVDDAVTLAPGIHLQISGLLIRRGLRTLPVCLSERRAADYLASQQESCVLSDTADPDLARTTQFEMNAFVECVLVNLSENSLSANIAM